MKNKFNIFYGFMVVITFLILVAAPVAMMNCLNDMCGCL